MARFVLHNLLREDAGLLTYTQPSEPSETLLNQMRTIIGAWDGRDVIVTYHAPTTAWMFIAIHDRRLGAATGGCRIKEYNQPLDALRDALRLAEGMTHKWAILNAGRGGGKAVIAIPEGLTELNRHHLLRCLGETIESLEGAFQTAGDLGTTNHDLTVLATYTQFTHSLDPVSGLPIDSGMYTALGVAAGIRSSLKELFGCDLLSGRKVLIQGVGHVGGHLAKILMEEGARVTICDTDQKLAERIYADVGCDVVLSRHMLDAKCDVYAPCAIGGTLNHGTVRRLNSQIVAGAANNQLQEPIIADLLQDSGILYAPDYVINAGGAIALPMLHEGANETEVLRKVSGIGETLIDIFAEASEYAESPYRTAERRVQLFLDEAAIFLASGLDHLFIP